MRYYWRFGVKSSQAKAVSFAAFLLLLNLISGTMLQVNAKTMPRPSIKPPRGWVEISFPKHRDPHLLAIWVPFMVPHDLFRENISAMRFLKARNFHEFVSQSVIFMQRTFPTIRIVNRSMNRACGDTPSEVVTMKSIFVDGTPISTTQVYSQFAGSTYLFTYTRAENEAEDRAATQSILKACGL